MPKALIVNVSNAGGGLIFTSPGCGNIFINGRNPAVVGSRIANHGISPHNNPTMAQGSPNIRCGVGKRPLCREGDLATCAHPGTNGSNNTIAN